MGTKLSSISQNLSAILMNKIIFNIFIIYSNVVYMKKLFFAVLTLSVLVGCKDEKPPKDLFGPTDDFKTKPNSDSKKFGPTETDVDEHGFKLKPQSDGPIIIDHTKTSCLWCGVHLGSERNPKIILTLDTLSSPRLLNENQLCGFKCYNEFKNSYFKNNSDEITNRHIGSIYRIKIISK